MPKLQVDARSEVWPLKEAFTISRGSKTAAHVVVATISDGVHVGRGEAVPYARYSETVDGVLQDIRKITAKGLRGRSDLIASMAPGAARNALDCAFWDLEAKRTGTPVADLADIAGTGSVVTAFTLSLDTPEAMARKAAASPSLPLLKLKLGGAGDRERMHAVRAARPDARLIVDANEAWTIDLWPELMAAAAACGVEVIEQPLAAANDETLASLPRSVPLCADESVHVAADLPRLVGLYDAINIKLDKAGGLTGALQLKREARARGFKIMVGSMVATSLAVAPALLLAGDAEWTDLDGPLLLAQDRVPGLDMTDGVIAPLDRGLWG